MRCVSGGIDRDMDIKSAARPRPNHEQPIRANMKTTHTTADAAVPSVFWLGYESFDCDKVQIRTDIDSISFSARG